MLSKVDYTHPSNIRFNCKKCGLCCGNTEEKTRHILLLKSEADSISTKSSLPKQQFTQQITNKPPYRYEMKKPQQGRCFFLKDNQCSIYPLRPLICRFYPFELKFSEAKATHVFDFTVECPGINKGKTMTRADFEQLFLLAHERFG